MSDETRAPKAAARKSPRAARAEADRAEGVPARDRDRPMHLRRGFELKVEAAVAATAKARLGADGDPGRLADKATRHPAAFAHAFAVRLAGEDHGLTTREGDDDFRKAVEAEWDAVAADNFRAIAGH